MIGVLNQQASIFYEHVVMYIAKYKSTSKYQCKIKFKYRHNALINLIW